MKKPICLIPIMLFANVWMSCSTGSALANKGSTHDWGQNRQHNSG